METQRYDVDTVKTGKNITEARRRKNIGVHQLATALGICGGAVYKWERGTAMPRIDNFFALCSILDVAPADICVFYNQESTEKMRQLCRK